MLGNAGLRSWGKARPTSFTAFEKHGSQGPAAEPGGVGSSGFMPVGVELNCVTVLGTALLVRDCGLWRLEQR